MLLRKPLSKLPPVGAWKLTSSMGGEISDGVDDGEYCGGESMACLVVAVASQGCIICVAARPAQLIGVSNAQADKYRSYSSGMLTVKDTRTICLPASELNEGLVAPTPVVFPRFSSPERR